MAETCDRAQTVRPGSTSAVLPWVLDALATRDLIYVAADEASALELQRAIAAGWPDAVVVFCPASDALPGDSAPPSPENAGQRTAALHRLRSATTEQGTVRLGLVTTAEAVARLYPPPDRFDIAPPVLRVGQPLDLATFADQLQTMGYHADDRVDEPGEMAVRGQVIDLFPADAAHPFRVDVRDDAIVSIRSYDAGSQLTVGECDCLSIGRVAEPEFDIGVTLLEHLPDADVALAPGADKRRRQSLALAADAASRRPARAMRDSCDEERWQAALAERTFVEVAEPGDAPPRFVEQRNPLRRFATYAQGLLDAGSRVVLLGSPRDLRFLKPRIGRATGRDVVEVSSWSEATAVEPGSIAMLAMPLDRGFLAGPTAAVAAADLLGSRAERDTDGAAAAGAEVFALGELRVGDVVVHEDHGIAVVAGLEALADEAGDAIVLRFAGEARRLVPVAEANRIWRYGADVEAVTLDKLDGSSWERRRPEVMQSIALTARELVRRSAEQMAQEAPVLDPEPAAYERFASGFPFTETADQARAIAAVQEDLASGKPMDRLVIGDVGFGKTEVALRAAAIAALAGGQVAMAAPTTVLARQHLETFRQRFAGTGIEVAGLSRFTTTSEKRRVAAGLKDGSIAVVIGTGAVSGKSITYRDLALAIIDEEQKFGAADKAKLRALGASHVLTLSATPIPRTLQSALVGLQQLSVIATPPARRRPIRTVVAGFDPVAVRSALLREKSRGGQSFVVVPRVEDIAPMAARLSQLVPELELVEAHGKLAAAEIDEAMVNFAAGEADVLLATNIIESGLDVPRANTMIVWRADRFGLSQLHQLRGRVGRGARRGHIHLLTDPEARIAPRTLARLKTLQAFDRLGAGFAISARDLDLRGAGDLLGEEQTGHVKLIGVDLYQHLLEQAVREARGEAVEDWTPVLNLEVGGRLPAEWVPEEDLRISLYVRLARMADIAALDRFEEELEDRFGAPPDEAKRLLALSRVRVLAHDAGVARVDAGPAAIALTPRENGPAPIGELVDAGERWLLKERIEDVGLRLARAEQLLGDCVASADP